MLCGKGATLPRPCARAPIAFCGNHTMVPNMGEQSLVLTIDPPTQFVFHTKIIHYIAFVIILKLVLFIFNYILVT